jgi:ribosome-binding factor A
MAKEFSRTRRVADQIQRNMAELIQMELGDPRLGMVTVTAVEVTREFESARVFFTVLGKELSDKSQIEETTATLNHAAGFLRSALAKRLKLRTTPKLIFVYDSSMERGNQLTDLIKSAVNKPSDDNPDDS